jgi:hypothetical protein
MRLEKRGKERIVGLITCLSAQTTISQDEDLPKFSTKTKLRSSS